VSSHEKKRRQLNVLLKGVKRHISCFAECREERQSMLRILLAEDDVNHATLACQTLEDEGHRITLADNGKSALEAVVRERFDLVLLDMRLPEIDGREFIGRVRMADGSVNAIPIVVLTGYGVRQHIDFFKRHGVRHYLAKPYDCDELAAIIRGYDAH
jgi:CheY-like chemotaxis protein